MTAVAPATRHDMILLTQADLDGELNAPEATVVATHRATCPACTAAYRIVRATQTAVQQQGIRYVLPEEARKAVIARLRQAARSDPH